MLMYLMVMFWLYRASVLVWLGLTSCMRMVMPTPPPIDDSQPRVIDRGKGTARFWCT